MQSKNKTKIAILSCVAVIVILMIGLFFLRQNNNIRKSVEYIKESSTEFAVSSKDSDLFIKNGVEYDKSTKTIRVSFHISYLDEIMAEADDYDMKKARWTARDLANNYHSQIKKRYGTDIPVMVIYSDAYSRTIYIEERSDD